MLQFRNEREKCQLQGNHIATLEQLIEKQKKKNIYLETANINKDIAANQIPNELNKQHDIEIQQILRRCEYEKGEIIDKFQI